MIKRMICKILRTQIEEATEAAETRMKENLRLYVKEECCEIVKELFGQNCDVEHKWSYFGGPYEVDTLVGTLKKQILQKTAIDFDERHKATAMSFIKGEEFIDEVIHRINKKQIGS